MLILILAVGGTAYYYELKQQDFVRYVSKRFAKLDERITTLNKESVDTPRQNAEMLKTLVEKFEQSQVQVADATRRQTETLEALRQEIDQLKAQLDGGTAPVAGSQDKTPVAGDPDEAATDTEEQEETTGKFVEPPVADSNEAGSDEVPTAHETPVAGSQDKTPVAGGQDKTPVAGSQDKTPVTGDTEEPAPETEEQPETTAEFVEPPVADSNEAGGDEMPTAHETPVAGGQDKTPMTGDQEKIIPDSVDSPVQQEVEQGPIPEPVVETAAVEPEVEPEVETEPEALVAAHQDAETEPPVTQETTPVPPQTEVQKETGTPQPQRSQGEQEYIDFVETTTGKFFRLVKEGSIKLWDYLIGLF